MTALPDWMALPPEGLSAADYEALPEEVCRHIEIVDGAIVVTPAHRRLHQRIARRLAGELEQAAAPELTVDTGVDLRLRDVPLLNRRPDVVVYDSALPDDALLRPQHCLLVVEVMSPGSVTADQTDKPAEYAAAGIEHFWRVESDAQDDRCLTVFRYRLDPTTRLYALLGADTDKLSVSAPVELTIDFDSLL
ncbi:Endonuclease, Uma2 family (restriction endonuclease fold) [Saccharopolyspora kobensis]|uniref:Endonuclease, Uma2 family (Restriction endonuclease fold) n=1 Tax=Saccharopolyspora kobensis TaxID=146035 RepID=A0A1H6C1F2_9PSEU|nr:Uma2 family endonuclease [Saccharopolyspora kobensis]SEG66809.1 Endonuclease, Uma2 family (restriction endonuclease fold) [Saccharopolyspora kobensis]SFC24074.1 Endonuclease, Uma2 family (restriction endonuclease fold) [Saccharopolyspora kobensis]